MRKCYKCEKHRSLEEFHWRNKAKGQRQSHCKECAKEYKKLAYQNRKQHYKDLSKRNREIARNSNLEKMAAYLKENPCVDCGEKDILVLEFDHLNNKKKNVSRLLSECWKWSSIKKEIDKCVVRCSNCHQRKTAYEQGWDLIKYL